MLTKRQAEAKFRAEAGGNRNRRLCSLVRNTCDKSAVIGDNYSLRSGLETAPLATSMRRSTP